MTRGGDRCVTILLQTAKAVYAHRETVKSLSNFKERAACLKREVTQSLDPAPSGHGVDTHTIPRLRNEALVSEVSTGFTRRIIERHVTAVESINSRLSISKNPPKTVREVAILSEQVLLRNKCEVHH